MGFNPEGFGNIPFKIPVRLWMIKALHGQGKFAALFTQTMSQII